MNRAQKSAMTALPHDPAIRRRPLVILMVCACWLIFPTRIHASDKKTAVPAEQASAVSAPVKATATSQQDATAELLKKVDQLVENNKQLEQQNKALLETIQALRSEVGKQNGTPSPLVPPGAKQAPTDATLERAEIAPATSVEANAEQPERKTWGTYTPNFGFKIADTKYGDVNLSILTYVRYVNQRALNDSYMDAFGNVKGVQQRQDVELNKLQIKFLGWLFSPKLRYFLYSWTNNANQGGKFYIALAGYTGFNFNRHFSLWGGLNGLPGTRSIEGNFPFWLGVDSRHIADEFFRPSYTSGIWSKGEITSKLRYHVMVGNNLSTLGVTASQFDKGFNTIASALVWTPTTGEFGAGFGDFEDHQKLATRLAFHFTRSNENKESQPTTDSFENTQIRLSDGTVIFTPNIFGPGVTVTDVRYQMSSIDGGLKYHGMALEGEYFMRWLDDFKGPGTSVVPDQFDHGFQLQASAMAIPQSLQFYLGGSQIYGNHGNPFDVRFGANWFPFKNRVVRWNNEALYLNKSPVGYTAVPFTVGGTGWVFHSNFEISF